MCREDSWVWDWLCCCLEPRTLENKYLKKKNNFFFFDWGLTFYFGYLSKNNSLSQTWGPSASSEALQELLFLLWWKLQGMQLLIIHTLGSKIFCLVWPSFTSSKRSILSWDWRLYILYTVVFIESYHSFKVYNNVKRELEERVPLSFLEDVFFFLFFPAFPLRLHFGTIFFCPLLFSRILLFSTFFSSKSSSPVCF